MADVVAILPIQVSYLMFTAGTINPKLTALMKFNQLVKFYKVIHRTCQPNISHDSIQHTAEGKTGHIR